MTIARTFGKAVRRDEAGRDQLGQRFAATVEREIAGGLQVLYERGAMTLQVIEDAASGFRNDPG